MGDVEVVTRHIDHGFTMQRCRTATPPFLSVSGTARARPLASVALPRRSPSGSAMLVHLIVQDGPLAGTLAPIKPGYYLIGRHAECQIRPESRSVSRRHCLVLHNEHGFGVFDLQSSWGTFVNRQRLEPHTWRHLRDGDFLRVGLFGFRVSMRPDETPDWVAQQPVQTTEPAAEAVDVPNASTASPPSSRAASIQSELEPKSKETERKPESEQTQQAKGHKKSKPPANQLEFRKPRKSTFTLNLFRFDRLDWKLTLAILAIVAASAHFAFRLYRFQGKPPIEIRQGLD